MLESEIESYLIERVKALGGEVRKVKWIGRHGAPDRLVMLPEVQRGAFGSPPYRRAPAAHFWIELKAPGKKLDAHQEREHKRMRKYRMSVVVIDSKEKIDRLLARG